MHHSVGALAPSFLCFSTPLALSFTSLEAQELSHTLAHLGTNYSRGCGGIQPVCPRQLHHCCTAVLRPLVTETLANCAKCSLHCSACCPGTTVWVLNVFPDVLLGGSSSTSVDGLFITLSAMSRSLQRWECQDI
ncbi:hypothetical protein B0H14DRAFT_2816457 [Mycena olivaceomarginata]|nr:hypothetical protein B0H14DRAFT_2816457 [Mycena olivaceomarginata]